MLVNRKLRDVVVWRYIKRERRISPNICQVCWRLQRGCHPWAGREYIRTLSTPTGPSSHWRTACHWTVLSLDIFTFVLGFVLSRNKDVIVNIWRARTSLITAAGWDQEMETSQSKWQAGSLAVNDGKRLEIPNFSKELYCPTKILATNHATPL